MHTIPLLTPEAAADLLAQAAHLEYIDGKATARGKAKEAKTNLQARRAGPAYEAVASSIIASLASDHRVRDVAFPRRSSRRYPGEGLPGSLLNGVVEAAALKVAAGALRVGGVQVDMERRQGDVPWRGGISLFALRSVL